MFEVGTQVRLVHPEGGDQRGVVDQVQPMGESLMVQVRLDAGDLVIVDAKFLEVVS